MIGSRIPVNTVVRAFSNGDSPETIRGSFPNQTLKQVYDAIALYLGHREEGKTPWSLTKRSLSLC